MALDFFAGCVGGKYINKKGEAFPLRRLDLIGLSMRPSDERIAFIGSSNRGLPAEAKPVSLLHSAVGNRVTPILAACWPMLAA